MCYRKPGPRCSKSAWKSYQSALASGDEQKIEDAKHEWLETPDGINHLRSQGKEDLASLLQERRNAAVARAKARESAYSTHRAEAIAWRESLADTPMSEEPYETAIRGKIPEGKRINASLTKAQQKRRDARNLPDDVPVVTGDANPVSYCTMGHHRKDFSHDAITPIRNPDEASPEMLGYGSMCVKPKGGIWSAHNTRFDNPEHTNASGVPTNWWIAQSTESYEPEEERARVEKMQNNTIVIVPRPDAKVIRVNTTKDYLRVAKRYYDHNRGTLNYEKMARDGADGFSVSTEVANSGLSFSSRGHDEFSKKLLRHNYGWDGDSTVWFNNKSFDVVVPPETHNQPTQRHSSSTVEDYRYDYSISYGNSDERQEQDALEYLRKKLLG